MKRFVLGVLAYVIPTFVLGFVWHLVVFARTYEALAIYRSDVIIPFGLLAIAIQAIVFAWLYQTVFARREATFASRALTYGALGAGLSWSFTTLAVAAKNVMTSVPSYLLVETAFTAVLWAMVAPLTVLAFHHAAGEDARAGMAG